MNDYLEFPYNTQLDLYNYTVDSQRSNNNETMYNILLLLFIIYYSNNSYKYNLNGIICHLGTARIFYINYFILYYLIESGHYISYINDRRSETTQWNEYNDTIVSNFNPERIPCQCFGGNTNNSTNNAYMLIYDLSGNNNNESIYIYLFIVLFYVIFIDSSVSSLSSFSSVKELAKGVQDDYYTIISSSQYELNLFSSNFTSFLFQIIKNYNWNEVTEEAKKFFNILCKYIYNVFGYSNRIKDITEYFSIINKLYNEHPQLQSELYLIITDPNISIQDHLIYIVYILYYYIYFIK